MTTLRILFNTANRGVASNFKINHHLCDKVSIITYTNRLFLNIN